MQKCPRELNAKVSSKLFKSVIWPHWSEQAFLIRGAIGKGKKFCRSRSWCRYCRPSSWRFCWRRFCCRRCLERRCRFRPRRSSTLSFSSSFSRPGWAALQTRSACPLCRRSWRRRSQCCTERWAKINYHRVVVVVKWSACLPSTPKIRVRIPLKPIVFSVMLCLKRTKINKKRPGLAHFQKNNNYCLGK